MQQPVQHDPQRYAIVTAFAARAIEYDADIAARLRDGERWESASEALLDAVDRFRITRTDLAALAGRATLGKHLRVFIRHAAHDILDHEKNPFNGDYDTGPDAVYVADRLTRFGRFERWEVQ